MATLVPFTLDLTAHEGTRLAAVLDALGPLWDPAEIDTGEAQAHRMLYARVLARYRGPTAVPGYARRSARTECPVPAQRGDYREPGTVRTCVPASEG